MELNPQLILEAREFYSSKLRRIWIDSLYKPATKSDIRFWIFKSNQYINKLQALGNPEDNDANLIFIVKMSHIRLNRRLEVLSRV